MSSKRTKTRLQSSGKARLTSEKPCTASPTSLLFVIYFPLYSTLHQPLVEAHQTYGPKATDMRMILSHSFILTALLVLLSSTVAQPPPPPTQPPAAPPAPPPCNPFIQVCSNPNCTSSENIGSVQVLSPNTSAYFYVGSAINVSWTYSGETDSTQFPINNIHIYYQKVDAASWNQVATVPARATNYSWLLDTFAAGTGGNFKVGFISRA